MEMKGGSGVSWGFGDLGTEKREKERIKEKRDHVTCT